MSIDFINKTFSALKHKNFRLFFVGQTVSLTGTWLQQTAMAWLIYDMTGSKLLLGLIATIGALPMLFLSIFGGVIADRYSKRKILIFTQSFSMILAFVLSYLIFFHYIKIWHIFVTAILGGAAFAIDMPVRQSFFNDIVKKDDLMNAVALNSSIVNAARIIGPALAGIIMAKFGIFWCFVLNGLSFLAVLGALFKIQIPKLHIVEKTQSILQYTISGFNYVKTNKLIFNLMLIMVIIGIFGWSYSILFPAIAKDIFSKGEKGYALLVSVNGVGAFLGALFIAYMGKSKNAKKYVNYGIYLFSSMIFLLAFCKIYWLSLIIISFAGFGLLTYFSTTTTLIQLEVDDSVRGRVMGIWALVFGGVVPLGSIFAGTCAQYLGISWTLIISALVCALLPTLVPTISGSTEELKNMQEDSIKA